MTLRAILTTFAVLLAFSASLPAQGVTLRAEARVLYGNAERCSQPAQIDYQKIKKLTPEWKLIKADGIDKGSARYELLIEDMHKRLQRICAEVAKALGKDCILRKGDVESENGLVVSDITDDVVAKLESDTVAS